MEVEKYLKLPSNEHLVRNAINPMALNNGDAKNLLANYGELIFNATVQNIREQLKIIHKDQAGELDFRKAKPKMN